MNKNMQKKLEEIRSRKYQIHESISRVDASDDVRWITINGTPVPIDSDVKLGGKIGKKIQGQAKGKKAKSNISELSEAQERTFEERTHVTIPDVVEPYSSQHQNETKKFKLRNGAKCLVDKNREAELRKGMTGYQYENFLKKEYKEFCDGGYDLYQNTDTGTIYAARLHQKKPLFMQEVERIEKDGNLTGKIGEQITQGSKDKTQKNKNSDIKIAESRIKEAENRRNYFAAQYEKTGNAFYKKMAESETDAISEIRDAIITALLSE